MPVENTILGTETFYDFKTNPKGTPKVMVHFQTPDGVVKSVAWFKEEWDSKPHAQLISTYLADLAERKSKYLGVHDRTATTNR